VASSLFQFPRRISTELLGHRMSSDHAVLEQSPSDVSSATSQTANADRSASTRVRSADKDRKP
jgi:hypothetical protein